MAETTPEGLKGKHKRPIKRLVLFNKRRRHLEASIDDNGELVLEGQDLGPVVRNFFGAGEYEYFYRIPSRYKDTLLLRLLKDRFNEDFLFDDWLKKHGVPYAFSNYYSPD
jgi:hypothetical protein